LIFWNTVSFAILVFLMYKWVLPPIISVMKERQKSIEDSVLQAELNRKKTEELMVEHKEKIAEANLTASKIIDQAKAEGERTRSEIIGRADKQAELILEQTREDLSSEKKRILSEAKREISDLVVMAAEKVVGRTIKKEDNLKIIEEALR